MPKTDTASPPPADADAPGAIPQGEDPSSWNSLEMGFFTAGDAPHHEGDEVDHTRELEPVDFADLDEPAQPRPGVGGRLRAAWHALDLGWRGVAVIFGPGTLIGVVLLLAGGSSAQPAPPPAASMSRMAPAGDAPTRAKAPHAKKRAGHR
jgi:hypothetical protein